MVLITINSTSWEPKNIYLSGMSSNTNFILLLFKDKWNWPNPKKKWSSAWFQYHHLLGKRVNSGSGGVWFDVFLCCIAIGNQRSHTTSSEICQPTECQGCIFSLSSGGQSGFCGPKKLARKRGFLATTIYIFSLFWSALVMMTETIVILFSVGVFIKLRFQFQPESNKTVEALFACFGFVLH